ncbi:MAG: DNA polymerase IV [Jatrophihabitans sp.]
MGRSADLPRFSGETDGDDAGCRMLHVDMDAFFASVEIRRRPELRDKPVVVGGGVRGVVAAASYEARRFGIRSAMPMSRALRMCPDLVVLPPDRAAYSEASRRVMAIFSDVTPLVEPLSLDEAFLDVSGSIRLLGRPADIARHIRSRVVAELGLTCSVGVAATKFVAKLASSRCKPNGLLVVPAADTLSFLHPLPVTALWGVGPSTAQALARRGITTVADLAVLPIGPLTRAVGAASAEHLAALARGEDPREVDPDRVEKSISSDRTFDLDLTDLTDVRRELLRLSEEVGSRLRGQMLVGRTVGIKVRYADFRTVTRVRTLGDWTEDTGEIYAIATALYTSLRLDRPRIRLLGVKVDGLRDAASTPRQLTLDLGIDAAGEPSVAVARKEQANNDAQRASDAAAERFGAGAVRPASLILPVDPSRGTR